LLRLVRVLLFESLSYILTQGEQSVGIGVGILPDVTAQSIDFSREIA
jgi:hypothetical protein